MKKINKIWLTLGLGLTSIAPIVVSASCNSETKTKEATTETKPTTPATPATPEKPATSTPSNGTNSSQPTTPSTNNPASVPTATNQEAYRAPFEFIVADGVNNNTPVKYDGRKQWTNIRATIEEKAKSIERNKALIQKYSAGNRDGNVTPAGFGIVSGSNANTNIVITVKNGIEIGNIISTVQGNKNNKNNKYFEGSYDDAERSLTIKFKTTQTGDEVLTQKFVFDAPAS
ncbi:hypothetical protein [Mycoplasma nasistruthionis]|uniref:Variable surface lipoprotein n=1 Tax=Mycoplasma nasistruthionis TaxID=353852 RepID=A0A4Y6I6C4_9MOLU|nr:hypothetical protein [Mycoplasma nasistruthionis]QCZ36627.1 hypothetical protein FG904_01160 [Mycoplasma nasistruthionis]QDF64922.1 hypothetical protein FIV53_01180 [Mycoplasma nasistruthionis]